MWGPVILSSTKGYKYYISFVDDFTKFTWIFLLFAKTDAKQVVIQFQAYVERFFERQLKCLQTDWGGEFCGLASLFILFKHSS